MEETEIKAVLSDESCALKEWHESHEADLTGIIEAIQCIKGFINDYLTDLITREEVFISKKQNLRVDNMTKDGYNDVQEEIQEDRLSRLVKGMSSVGEQRTVYEKRKINSFNTVKKFKK